MTLVAAAQGCGVWGSRHLSRAGSITCSAPAGPCVHTAMVCRLQATATRALAAPLEEAPQQPLIVPSSWLPYASPAEQPQRQSSLQYSDAAEQVHSGEAVSVFDLRSVWRTPRMDNKQLTSMVSNSSNCSDLLQLLQQQYESFNTINLSAAFQRTVRLCRRPGVRPLETRIASSQLVPLLIELLRSRLNQLQPRALASVVHSLGSLDVRDKELYTDLAALAEPRMSEYTTQGLSNMLWAFARSGMAPSARWMDHFVGVCHSKLPQFNAQELAMVMWALAKLHYRLHVDRQSEFLHRAMHLLPTASAQALSMFAHALGLSHHNPGQEWMDALVNIILPFNSPLPGAAAADDMPDSTPHPSGTPQQQQPSSTAGNGQHQALPVASNTPQQSDRSEAARHDQQEGSHRRKHASSMQKTQQHQQVPDVPPWSVWQQQGSNSSRQGSWQRPPPPVLHSMSGQASSVCLWGLACMGYCPSPLVSARMCQHLYVSRLRHYQGVDQAMLVYALAKMSVPVPDKLMVLLLKRMDASVQHMDNSSLAMTAWALATMQTAAPWSSSPQSWLGLFLVKFLSTCYSKLPVMNCKNLSMLVWALGKLRVSLPAPFLATLERRIEQMAPEFGPQDISLLVWGMVRLNVPPSPVLIMEFFLATDGRLTSFKPQELSQMIWAIAKAGQRPDKVWVEEFLHATFPRLPAFAPQGLANMVCAIAQLGIKPPPAWLYALVKAAQAALPVCNRQDLTGLVTGLQAINAPPSGLQLQKLDDFVSEAQALLDSLPAAPQQRVAVPIVPQRANRAMRAAAIQAAAAAEAAAASAALTGNGTHHSLPQGQPTHADTLERQVHAPGVAQQDHQQQDPHEQAEVHSDSSARPIPIYLPNMPHRQSHPHHALALQGGSSSRQGRRLLFSRQGSFHLDVAARQAAASAVKFTRAAGTGFSRTQTQTTQAALAAIVHANTQTAEHAAPGDSMLDAQSQVTGA